MIAAIEDCSAPSRDDLQRFFEDLLLGPEQQRAALVCGLLELRECANLADMLTGLLRAILYERIDFKLLDQECQLFGADWPLRYAWLTAAQRAFIVRLFAHRALHFKSVRVSQGNHVACSAFAYNGETAWYAIGKCAARFQFPR